MKCPNCKDIEMQRIPGQDTYKCSRCLGIYHEKIVNKESIGYLKAANEAMAAELSDKEGMDDFEVPYNKLKEAVDKAKKENCIMKTFTISHANCHHCYMYWICRLEAGC